MFDIVRNNKRIVQGFLVLITLPFAFWGVESYVRNVDVGGTVATVGSGKITEQELQAALRDQQERLREQTGGRVDPALLQSPEMRRAVLDSLVNQKLMQQQAQKANIVVSDGDLAGFIAGVPALQENGRFSRERYESFVASQGISKDMFEGRLRQDLAMQQLLLPVSEAGVVGQTSGRRWLSAQLEQRDVAEARLLPEMYAAQIKLAADATQKYYEENRKRFELPEQVRAEFVVLNQASLGGQAAPTEDEVKAAYQARTDRYKEEEKRRASHILIRAAKDAPEAEIKAARAKADDLLAQAKKAPNDFARLAKQNSQDPGSAEKGGDLDWFGRGMMVKPFEDAAFALKDGQLSEVVRSDFGFHIIRLTGIRAERVKPLDEVRAEIVGELKNEAANKKYVEAAEAFGNVVYEQADSLKPAIEKWKLPVRQSDWMAKGGKLPPPFDNPKLAAALFSDDAVKNHRNTEAIEVAPGTLVAARVLEHKPAAVQSLESVKAEIERRLVREESIKLAIKDGEDKLARLARGEAVTLTWSPVQSVTRLASQGMAPDAARAVFKADVAKLPAYAGAAVPGLGYALYRISGFKAGDAEKADPRVAFLAQQYQRVIAEEEFSAWLATLKARYPVEIHKSALEAKERER